MVKTLYCMREIARLNLQRAEYMRREKECTQQLTKLIAKKVRLAYVQGRIDERCKVYEEMDTSIANIKA